MTLREELFAFAQKEYGIPPEYIFQGDPDSAVFRHEDNRKWFAIFMYVKRRVLGLPGEGRVDILDIKADPFLIDSLIGKPGFFRAYHMNKTKWMTVLLDGTVALEQICDLLDMSYSLTASRKKKKQSPRFGPKDWIIPANPKYYDVVQAFEKEEVIDWKQSSDVRVGDILYMYVGAPYSSIMYKCRAVEVDIPWDYESKELSVKKVMRIRLLQKYTPGVLSFDKLKEFGVYAVRGPRYMPNSLKEEINYLFGEA